MSARRAASWRIPVLGVLAAAAVLVAVPRDPSSAASAGFGASSSAFGARISVTISKAPLVPNIVDGGGPLAQTTLDSLGTSLSLASFPYPGDVVLNMPGLMAGLGPQAPGLVSGIPGLVGANVPGLPADVLELLSQVELPGELVEPLVTGAPALPPYPFAAQADAFTPHHEVDLGVGKLTADASPDAVSARATSAPGAPGAVLAPLEASSSVRRADDGSLVVEATGSISGLRVGPIVIGGVTSTAKMVRAVDGAVTRSSTFRVSGIQVGSLSVDLTPDGFSIGGTPVPSPVADTINGTLAAAGLEMRLLEEVQTDSAVVAGGLELRRPQDFGPLGMGTIRVILGQSSARLDDAATLPSPATPEVEVPAAVGVVGGGDLGTAIDTGGAGSVTPRPATAAGGRTVEVRRTAAAEPFDAKGLYLLLIAAAAVIVGIGPVLRAIPGRVRPTRE